METPGFQLGIPDLGNAFGDGTRFICDVELPLFLTENLPKNFRELPQVMGGKYPVHMGIAGFDSVGNNGLTGHTAAQKNFLIRVAALGMGQGS